MTESRIDGQTDRQTPHNGTGCRESCGKRLLRLLTTVGLFAQSLRYDCIFLHKIFGEYDTYIFYYFVHPSYKVSYLFSPLDSKGNYSGTSNDTKLVHWPLMGGLLHLVQREGAWAGCGPAQSPPHYTKYNNPPIDGKCTNFMSMSMSIMDLYSAGS